MSMLARLIPLLVAPGLGLAFAGPAGARAPVLLVSPEVLGEGSGDVTVTARTNPGAALSLKVEYWPDGASPTDAPEPVLVNFAATDNAAEDLEPRRGKLRVTLPPVFARAGHYLVSLASERDGRVVVRESAGNGLLGPIAAMADRLRLAAGSGFRAGTVAAPEDAAVYLLRMDRTALPAARDSLQLAVDRATTPAWSADGRSLAVSLSHDGTKQIAAYTATDPERIAEAWRWAPPDAADVSPVWSPDGDAVVFVRQLADGGDLWLLELDAAGRPAAERRLTELGSVSQAAFWDRARGIGFEAVHPALGPRLWTIRAGPHQATGTPSLLPVGLPPDMLRGIAGNAVAVSIQPGDEGVSQIILFQPGAEPRRVLEGERVQDRWPVLSPDGHVLAFSGSR